MLPGLIEESDTCLAIEHPKPQRGSKHHLVLFPKADIKNIAEVAEIDSPYVFGCFALVRRIKERFEIKNYKVETNGPERQHLSYLHFHLISY